MSVETNSTDFGPMPFIRPPPQTAIERDWFSVRDSFNEDNHVGGWTWPSIRMINNTGFAPLEEAYSSIASGIYATMVQGWRNRFDQGDETVSANWQPQTAVNTAVGPQLMVYFEINMIPLITGCAASFILMVLSLWTVFEHDFNHTDIRDGGVIDVISLLKDSALPGIIAAPTAADTESERSEVLRARAERTFLASVSLSISILNHADDFASVCQVTVTMH